MTHIKITIDVCCPPWHAVYNAVYAYFRENTFHIQTDNQELLQYFNILTVRTLA